MRRILSFSATIKKDLQTIGNCSVSYHYEKINGSAEYNICYVLSVLYINNDKSGLNPEIWNEQKSSCWVSIDEGKRLVLDSLKKLYPGNSSFDFEIKDENYAIEKNHKQYFILRDFKNGEQYVQYYSESYTLAQDTKLGIDVSFQEIEEKYLQ